MQLTDVGVQIATRDLQANGRTITVVIGRPEKFPEGEDYYCPYQITGIGNERVRYAGGLDLSDRVVFVSAEKSLPIVPEMAPRIPP